MVSSRRLRLAHSRARPSLLSSVSSSSFLVFPQFLFRCQTRDRDLLHARTRTSPFRKSCFAHLAVSQCFCALLHVSTTSPTRSFIHSFIHVVLVCTTCTDLKYGLVLFVTFFFFFYQQKYRLTSRIYSVMSFHFFRFKSFQGMKSMSTVTVFVL